MQTNAFTWLLISLPVYLLLTGKLVAYLKLAGSGDAPQPTGQTAG